MAFNSEATKQVAAFLAAISKEDCDYFIYFPLAHLHESVIKKDFLKANQLFRLILVADTDLGDRQRFARRS